MYFRNSEMVSNLMPYKVLDSQKKQRRIALLLTQIYMKDGRNTFFLTRKVSEYGRGVHFQSV